MSIVFKKYDPPNPEAAVQPVPDMEKAIEAVASGADPLYVSCFTMTGEKDASTFREECVALEKMLIAQIQSNAITTQTAATAFLVDNGRKDFPATKLIELFKITVGETAKPATWAEVVAAAKDEPEISVVPVVDDGK